FQFAPLRLAAREEHLRAGREPLEEIEEREMTAQGAAVAVVDHRVERAERVEDLPRVLPHPEPAPHLERERQEEPFGVRLSILVVEMIPEVSADGVAPRRGLDAVDVVRERAIEEPLENANLGEVRDGPPRARVREPEP